MHDASRTRTPLQRATVFFFTLSACLLSLPICALFIRVRSLRGSAPVRTACLVSSGRAVGLFTDWTSLRVCLFLYLPSTPVLIAINTRTPEFVTHRYKHTYKDDKFSAGYRLIDLWKLVTISLFPYRVDLDRWFLPVFGKPI
jgi:hypothetical protein